MHINKFKTDYMLKPVAYITAKQVQGGHNIHSICTINTINTISQS